MDQNALAGVEIMSRCWKFLPCQAKCQVSKTNKHQKHPDVGDVLSNVLILFCMLGFKGFSKGL